MKPSPEFIEDLDTFRKVFGSVRREWVKVGNTEYGTKLTGVEIDPVISDAIKGELNPQSGAKSKK